MKEISKYSRLAMYLEKLYDKLNHDFFEDSLERPVITVQSTARAYGHYTLYDAWSIKGEGYRELNIGAGTLDRPIENVLATLLHEMCHQYNDIVLNVQDCSRGGTYHNRLFKETAETHGLTVTKTATYGYSRTEPADELLEWILNNNIQEIQLCRNDLPMVVPVVGKVSGGTVGVSIGTKSKTGSRRYVCPKCGTIVRATRTVNVICGDCMCGMMEG